MHLLDKLPRGDSSVVLNCFSSDKVRRYAVEEGKAYTFSLLCHRSMAVLGAEIIFFRHQSNDAVHKATMHWTSLHCGIDTFTLKLNKMPLPVGLYACLVKVTTPEGEKYVETGSDQNGRLVDYPPFERTKPLLVYKRAFPVCKWVQGGIIYQIFIDRFYRGDDTPLAEGAVFNEDWDNGIAQYPAYPGAPLKNNMFFGGNLSGIIQKLPYLSSLGVNCLYLSPICKATSNHKYDTGNYMKIDPSFGDEDTLRELLQQAHSKGIHIILDGVFNHTGDDSLYFNKKGTYDAIGAYQSKDSPYLDWYYFKEYPTEYECWWNIDILPKLNLQNPQVRVFFLGEKGVIAHYSRMGVDGFRLDVADELDDGFISDAKARLVTFGEEKILYGEVWEDASNKEAYGKLKHYYWGDELDGVMNYPVRTGIIRYIKYGETAPLLYALESVMRNAPKEILHTLMNFLGTHDTERILSALADVDFEEKSNDEIAYYRLPLKEREKALRRLKLAFVCLSTLPGVATLFYGDEAGMEGYKDPFNRLPFPWNKGNAELLSFVRELFLMRRNQPVYKEGEFILHRLSQNELVYSRYDSKYHYLTVINRGDSTLHFESDCSVKVLFSDNNIGQNHVILPMSGVVLRVDKKAKCYLYSTSFEKPLGQ